MDAEFEVAPFKILVDTNESAPWRFEGHFNKQGKAIVYETIPKALWPDGLADYTIQGHEYGVQIERKSLADLYSTLGSRRDRFEREVDRLNRRVHISAVVVEAPLSEVRAWKGHGPAPASVEGTMRAWSIRYPSVHWHLSASRHDAELKAADIMTRYYSDFVRGKLPKTTETEQDTECH